jgi:hypothetical protein
MFEGVLTTDTFVISWRQEADRLVFVVDASLGPGHPNYEPPLPGEWSCYKPARLVFKGVRVVDGLPQMESSPHCTDADGSQDFGTLDELVAEPGGYRVAGDFGVVRIQADSAQLVFGPDE